MGAPQRPRPDPPNHTRGTQPRSSLLHPHRWRPRWLRRYQHGRDLPDPCYVGTPFSRARRDGRYSARDDSGGSPEGWPRDGASGTEVRLDTVLIWAGVSTLRPLLLTLIHPRS